VVTDEELPSAATLGGMQLNVSGIIGPALGGVLLYFLVANWVFGLSALCFILVILALLQWKGPEAESRFPMENHFLLPFGMFGIRRRFKWYWPETSYLLSLSLLYQR
jgi:MFS family permease